MKKRILSFVLALCMIVGFIPSIQQEVAATSEEAGFAFKFTNAAHTTTASLGNTTSKFEDSSRAEGIIHTIETTSEGYDRWGYVAQSFPNGVISISTEGSNARLSMRRPGNDPTKVITFDPEDANQVVTALCFELEITKAGTYTPVFEYNVYPHGPIVDLYLAPKDGSITDGASLSSYMKNVDSKYHIGTVDSYGTASAAAEPYSMNNVELDKGNYYFIMVPNGQNEALTNGSPAYYEYFMPKGISFLPAAEPVGFVYDFTTNAVASSYDIDALNAEVKAAKANYTAKYTALTAFGNSPTVNTSKTSPWAILSTRYALNATSTGNTYGEMSKDGLRLLLYSLRYFDETSGNGYIGSNNMTAGMCTHVALVIEIPEAGTHELAIYNNVAHTYGGFTEVVFGKTDKTSLSTTDVTNLYNSGIKLGWHDSSKVHNGTETNPAESFEVTVTEGGKYYLIFATPNGTLEKNKTVIRDNDAISTESYGYQSFNLSKITVGAHVVRLVTEAEISSDQLEVGETATITATSMADDGSELPGEVTYSYTPEDTSVVSVDATGKVTALKAGNTKITVTATCGDMTATDDVLVTVIEKFPDTVSLTYDFNELDGETSNNVVISGTNAGYSNTRGTWAYAGINGVEIKTQSAYGINIGTTSALPYAAIKVNIPYPGKYSAKLIHHMNQKSGGYGDVLLVPSNADTSSISAIKSNPDTISLFENVSYFNAGTNLFDVETDPENIFVPKAGEYFLVFHAKGTENNVTWGAYPHKLLLEGAKADETAVMYLEAKISKKILEKGDSADITVSGWMTDGTPLSDSVVYTYTPADPSVISVDANGKITALEDGRTSVKISASCGELTVSETVSVIVDSTEKTGYKVVYNIADVSKANTGLKPAFATLTRDSNDGFWGYIGNSQDQATPNWAFAYNNTGISFAQNRWVAFEINVPVEGTYSLYIEHGMHSGGCDVGVYVSDGDKTDSPIGDSYLVGSFSTLDPAGDGFKTFNEEPSFVANVTLKKGINRIAFRSPRSSENAIGVAGNIILDGGEKTTLMHIAMDISSAGKITLSGKMSDGSVADLSEAVIKYTSSDSSVAEAPESGSAMLLKGLGTTTVTAEVELDGVKCTAEKEYTVTKLPLAFSGVDTSYNFYERNGSWDPIGKPVEGFPITDRSEDIRGITYEYTGIEGTGNWQYNTTGPDWIPAKYAVFMYAGNVLTPTHYLRLQMPKNGDWLAFDIKVPAAGRYVAEFLYSAYYRAASISDIHILKKNDSTDTKEEIDARLSEDNRIATIDYMDAAATANYIAKTVELGDLEFEEAGEYILVFKRNDGGRGGYINPKKITLYGVNGMRYANIEVGKTELNYNESTTVNVTATRLDGSVVTPDSYEMTIESSDPSIVSVSGDGVITAKGDGVATVTVRIVDNTGKSAASTVEIRANDNTGVKSSEFLAKPEIYVEQETKTEWKVTMNSGNVITVPSDAITYTYSTDGIVSIDETGEMSGLSEGTAVVTAKTEFKGEKLEASATINVIVDDRKSEPTYYTYEMRDVVRENIEKYEWAKALEKSEKAYADKYLEQYEYMYYSMPGQGIPITIRPGLKDEPDYKLCRYCGVDVIAEYGNGTTGGWEVNIITRPWKLQCPACKRLFPSNNFASLYEIGRDQAGYYDVERAHAENERLKQESGGKTDYLRNDLYPEITKSNRDPLRKDENGEYYVVDGATWGVDDGFGYRPGRSYKISDTVSIEEHHMYIGTYLWTYFREVNSALLRFSRAYVMTGDIKYGRAGAILMDRLADVFPSFTFYPYNKMYPSSDGGSGLGKIHGRIDDAGNVQAYALECDAFFPALNDPQVISFLSENAEKWGLENKKTSAEDIWDNWEYGILDESFRAMKRWDIDGNFGMKQHALACAAIVRDREPVTSEMIDWIYKTNTKTSSFTDDRECTGGDLMTKLIDVIDRDGMGNEAAPNYNSVWISRMYQIADVLALYKGEGDYDLYKNPKFAQMFTSFMPVFLTESHTAEIGDTGGVANMTISDNLAWYNGGFMYLQNIGSYGKKLANYIYMRNGYTAEGLNYGTYVEDPERLESEIEALVDEGYRQQSEMQTGFGFAVLRGGLKTKKATTPTAQNTLRDAWIYFGITSGHGHLQMLNLGLDAYGLNIAPDTGYPELTGFQPNRYQWVRTTISHNTVTVNEKQQDQVAEAATPLHFEDAGKVKIMDIEAPEAYKETSEYRRCAVMVEVNDDVAYTVDFFRIKGGNQHTYSFHSQAENAHPIEGIDLTYQTEDGTPNTPYVGSYADVDWPVGQDPVSPTNTGSYFTKYPRGYSWMGKVRYDKSPESDKIVVEFDVEDYRNAITDSKGIKLRMTQVNDFVPDEVAITGGYVPQSSRNTGLPKTLDYVLVHRKGESLDTLFTTVFEPYRNTRYLSSIDAVEIKAVSGEEGDKDVAKAVKVTHENGRVDYVVYATNNSVTYNVADVFNFRGIVGVYSLNGDGNVIYRHVTDGDIIGVDTNTPANYKGTVVGYQRDLEFDNYIDVEMDCDDVSKLAGKYIHVANDGVRNAVYKIENASENVDGTVRLDIGTISLIRGHQDKTDFNSGYVYDVGINQKFVIPMSYTDENLPEFKDMSSSFTASSGSVVTFNVNAESPIDGLDVTYSALVMPRGAALDEETGAITWKPASSQVGENHFAITATDSEGRESTIHFNVQVYGSTTGGSGGGTTTSNKPEMPDVPETPETPEATNRFVDLGAHAWAADAINALAEEGIIKGTSETTFSPGNNITRADFAILLVRAFGLSSDNTENFSDVLDTDYFARELAIARNTGIVGGIGDNKYAPKNFITRQDMMVIVYRAIKESDAFVGRADPGTPDYPDFASVSDYAKEAVSALIGAGLVNGKNGKIAPTDYTTRAEVAVLLRRILEFIGQ